jgi:hypothetical protein
MATALSSMNSFAGTMATRLISPSGSFWIMTWKSGSFPTGMQKAMTKIQQQDARLIAMDAAIVAAIRFHAPEFEAAYLDDNLPRWFQRLLDLCTSAAEHISDRADAAFIETLSALLGDALGRGQAMCEHDAPGIVPEARSTP